MTRSPSRLAGTALLCLLGLLATTALAAPTGTGPAALLLTGGKVHTPDGVAEAMAVDAGGVILATGSAHEVGTLKTARTRVIDLDGASVLPEIGRAHV